MSIYPAINLDFLIQATRLWNIHLTVSKNWHPMAAMSEGGAELKMVINEIIYNYLDKYIFTKK